MSDEIRVYVIDKGRANLYMRYTDPMTNKPVERSAKTSDRAKALKTAAKWEAELQEGRYAKANKMSWEEFRDYYISNAVAGLAKGSITAYESTFNAVERICNPKKLAEITTQRVTAFATELRKEGLAEATVARHLRHLKASMRWANREGLLNVVPKFTMPKRAKGAKVMRGRPITLEEFERMLSTVEKVVSAPAAESWKFYLHGLWESGLRLSESLTLRWDDAPGAIVVDFTGKRPLLRIPAEVEKGNTDRLMPITPAFASMLQSVPAQKRRGRVFRLLADDGTPFPVKRWDVGQVIGEIGKQAGVIVDEKMVDGEPKRKFATAHDLRRAFGRRLADKGVKLHDLQQLMRHENIETTMKYYVGRDAIAASEALQSILGDTLGDTPTAESLQVEDKALEFQGVRMDRAGIEPATPGFSVLCSTN